MSNPLLLIFSHLFEGICFPWTEISGFLFSISSAYHFLLTSFNHLSSDCNQNHPHIWGSRTPSKAIVFFYRLLLDMFPSRENLFTRTVVIDPSLNLCPFCNVYVLTTSHWFLTCDLVTIWFLVGCVGR